MDSFTLTYDRISCDYSLSTDVRISIPGKDIVSCIIRGNIISIIISLDIVDSITIYNSTILFEHAEDIDVEVYSMETYELMNKDGNKLCLDSLINIVDRIITSIEDCMVESLTRLHKLFKHIIGNTLSQDELDCICNIGRRTKSAKQLIDFS